MWGILQFPSFGKLDILIVSQDKHVFSKGLLAYIASYVHKYGQLDINDGSRATDGPLDLIDWNMRLHGPRTSISDV